VTSDSRPARDSRPVTTLDQRPASPCDPSHSSYGARISTSRLPPAVFGQLDAEGILGITPINYTRERNMPQGDKSAYTNKQKRQAEHIEEGYEKRGVSRREAGRRAWATVNKEDGGGKKSGSGRGKKSTKSSSRKGGRKGGAASARRSKASRSASARKGAATRRRKSAAGGRKSTGGSTRKRATKSTGKSSGTSRSRKSSSRSRSAKGARR
jgi:plasmid stabilization system protein ParE